MNITTRTLPLNDYWQAAKSAHLLWLRRPVVFMGLAGALFLGFLFGAMDIRALAIFPLWIGVLAFVCLSLCYRVDMHLPLAGTNIVADLRAAQRPMTWSLVSAAAIAAIFVPFGLEIAKLIGVAAVAEIDVSAQRHSIVDRPMKITGFMIVMLIAIGVFLSLFHKALLAMKHGIKGLDAFYLVTEATEKNRPLVFIVEAVAHALTVLPLLFGAWGLGAYLILLNLTWVYFVNKAIFDGTAEPEAELSTAIEI